jgi:virginiamycin B lyase
MTGNVKKRWSLFLVAMTLASVGVSRATTAQVITEFRVPSSGQPVNIAPGPGGMWFTEQENRIGLITLDGRVSEFPINRPAFGIVAGPDGNLWFTSNGFLSRMTPTGVVTDFQVSGNAWGITVGSDRNVWFTEVARFPDNAGFLGRATIAGEITELRITSWAESITTGPNDNFWIPDWTEVGYDAIVRVTPSGSETRFLIPGGLNAPGDVGPAAVVVGPDGNVWFTEVRTAQVGRITPSGGITIFNASGGRGIAAGPDGNLWFTENTGNKIGRISTRGDLAEFDIPTPNAQPWGISAGADGNIWFTELAGNKIGRIALDRSTAPETLILPVVGSTPGANGTFFRTSVQLHNAGSAPIAGRIVFHPSGSSGTPSDPSLFYSLAPGQTQTYADLLPAMGLSGVGSADIEVTSGSAPVAMVRVFNDAGPSGTTGFTEELMRQEDTLGAERSGVLLIPSDLAAFRFNIGVRTLDADASMTFTVREASGAIVATVPRSFPAIYHIQQGASELLEGSILPAGGSVTVAVESGNAILYGATVDNTTGDPSLQIARPTAAPADDISGSWTGTYNGISYRCDTSALASFQQNGSNVVGMLTATGPCGDAFFFRGTVQGNTLDGDVTDNDTFVGHAHGTLSGSTLEITFDNGAGFIVSQLHLHR